MKKYAEGLVNFFTSGRENQSFLDAGWVVGLLRFAPARFKRRAALTVLGWSPHYFFPTADPDYRRHSRGEFLESEFTRNQISREKLCRYVLAPHLNPVQTVLDYGCGPGFLADCISTRVRAVYGVDLSRGALECARILHNRPNITYLRTVEIEKIPDGSVDLAVSFAVVQHITDSVLADILGILHRKLKDGGTLLVHVALDQSGWKTEQEWRGDSSVQGRLRRKLGLNVFTRNADDLKRLFASAGFSSIAVRPMAELCPEKFDDICSQHLLQTEK